MIEFLDPLTRQSIKSGGDIEIDYLLDIIKIENALKKPHKKRSCVYQKNARPFSFLVNFLLKKLSIIHSRTNNTHIF